MATAADLSASFQSLGSTCHDLDLLWKEAYPIESARRAMVTYPVSRLHTRWSTQAGWPSSSNDGRYGVRTSVGLHGSCSRSSTCSVIRTVRSYGHRTEEKTDPCSVIRGHYGRKEQDGGRLSARGGMSTRVVFFSDGEVEEEEEEMMMTMGGGGIGSAMAVSGSGSGSMHARREVPRSGLIRRSRTGRGNLNWLSRSRLDTTHNSVAISTPLDKRMFGEGGMCVWPRSNGGVSKPWRSGRGQPVSALGESIAEGVPASDTSVQASSTSVQASSTSESFLGSTLLQILPRVSAYLPHIVLSSTILALVRPESFTWFTTKYYAPSLGFLMFAVGVNLSLDDFQRAFRRLDVIALGYMGQFVVKPILGYLLATTIVPVLGLPEAIGSGIILVSCVSGAQLANYATYLVDKKMAPISIVITALSTASAVVVTPLLTLLLLGKRLPVNVLGMILNIIQIVVVPVAAGLLLNRFASQVSKAIRPFLPLMSALVTALCVGSPLSINIHSVRSPFGLTLLLPIVLFHCLAHYCGYYLAVGCFNKDTERTGIMRTISLVTGMQSSLLGLALANRFFEDPLVGLPCAISVVVMSLSGFGLVLGWNSEDKRRLTAAQVKSQAN